MKISEHLPNGDRIAEVEGTNYRAVIRLSAANQWLVIREYEGNNLSSLKQRLLKVGRSEELTKIWLLTDKETEEKFSQLEFKQEAEINGYYAQDDAVIMSYFLTEERATRQNKLAKEKKLAKVRAMGNRLVTSLPDSYEFQLISAANSSELAALYRKSSTSYPEPIDNSDYIEKKQQGNVSYGGIYKADKLVAAAEAAVGPTKTAKLGKFAIVPDYKEQGLAAYLLYKLERELKAKNYSCLYTTVPAPKFMLNKIFSQAGYSYTGTLINHYYLQDGLEDMNLWCKEL